MEAVEAEGGLLGQRTDCEREFDDVDSWVGPTVELFRSDLEFT